MNSTPARAVGIALAAIAAFTGATAEASADPLDCGATVHDAAGLLDQTRLDPVITSVATRLDADVRVRVEGTLDGGLDRRIDQLVEQCPGYRDDDTDELADDMVIISFSWVERENSIHYGADMGPELEDRWDAATDAMIPGLRAGDYTDAVIAGLRGLANDPDQSTAGSSSGSSGGASSSADDGGNGASGGIPGEVVFVLMVIGLVVVIGTVGRHQGWASAGSDGWAGDAGGSSSWSGGSGRRRSSFRSFGSSRSSGSRSRSSAGGSRRSGGGSRRAGGGSKKW